MSYDTEKAALGRIPLQVIEMDMGYCTRSYGVSPCTASGAPGSECFNTRVSCQDPANYVETTQTYRFCQPSDDLPIGVDMIPSINGGIARAAASITAGRGLGDRAVIKIELHDHSHNDVGVDPYVANRSYDPCETGTYWGKFLARNPYYENREIRLLSGYINPDNFSWTDFQTETYVISDISGPTKGKMVITAKDVLSLTYSKKSQYPVASEGELSADLTTGATSATLLPAGIGADYPSSGEVSIGREVMSFTRSGDVLTLTRAQWGTEALTHKAGDTIQICVSWTGTNILDVLEELLETGASIPTAYIPYGRGSSSWDDEKALWLADSNVTGILTKPEGVDKVIAEMSESFLFDIWWDAVTQEIGVKALAPPASGVSVNEFTDDYEIIKGSVTVKKDSGQRISEARVYYNKINYAEASDPDNFGGIFINTDISSEGSTRYGSKAIKSVYSRWVTDSAQASKLASRLVARFSDSPMIVSFDIDKKDDDKAEIAGLVDVNTKYIQGLTGENEVTRFQVTKAHDINGSTMRVTGLISSFVGQYAFIAPDGTPNYTNATDEQKAAYGFISPDTGVFSDGSSAYKII